MNLPLPPALQRGAITIGTFDGVHRGHASILEQLRAAATSAGGPSIIVTFDPHPRSVVHPGEKLELLTPLEERIKLLREAGIDEVVVTPFTPAFASMEAEDYIRDFLVHNFHPAAIVIGYDHRFGAGRRGNLALLATCAEKWNYTVSEIPATLLSEAAISSTKIRTALRAGDIAKANEMMGRPYALEGTVVEGKKLGRTIGYPTANLQPICTEQLIPAGGVYAVQVYEGTTFLAGGMLNIGRRPTVDAAGAAQTIEVNLLEGFSEDLYGRQLRLLFVARLRDEQQFSGIEALKMQLGKDAEAAAEALSQ